MRLSNSIHCLTGSLHGAYAPLLPGVECIPTQLMGRKRFYITVIERGVMNVLVEGKIHVIEIPRCSLADQGPDALCQVSN